MGLTRFALPISILHHSYINFVGPIIFSAKRRTLLSLLLYLGNLAGEISHEIAKQKTVNKKSLTLSVIKKILENKKAKYGLVELFEKKEIGIGEQIKNVWIE